MYKIYGFAVLILLSIVLIFFHSENKKETLVVAGDIYCPYNCDSNSEQQGYVIDIIRKIYEQKLGYKIDYKTNVTWTEAIKGCEEGIYDIIVEGTTTEIKQLMLPQQEAGISINGFITRAESPWFFRPDDLENNKKITWGIADGYDYGESLKPFFEQYKSDPNIIKIYNSSDIFKEMFDDLIINKTIDVIYDDLNVLWYHINKLNIKKQIKIAGTHNIAMMYIAFSPKNKELSEELLKQWDEYLPQLHRNGFIKSVLQKYDLVEWK
jgi:polar amino acid transport system substrate-binding protein